MGKRAVKQGKQAHGNVKADAEAEARRAAFNGVAVPGGVSAAVIDGDGLTPIPSGWVIYFRNEDSNPSALEGKLATVRYSGGGDRPVVRTILRSDFDGLWTLRAMDGSLTKDVEIVAAHEIVAFGQSKISEA